MGKQEAGGGLGWWEPLDRVPVGGVSCQEGVTGPRPHHALLSPWSHLVNTWPLQDQFSGSGVLAGGCQGAKLLGETVFEYKSKQLILHALDMQGLLWNLFSPAPTPWSL